MSVRLQVKASQGQIRYCFITSMGRDKKQRGPEPYGCATWVPAGAAIALCTNHSPFLAKQLTTALHPPNENTAALTSYSHLKL